MNKFSSKQSYLYTSIENYPEVAYCTVICCTTIKPENWMSENTNRFSDKTQQEEFLYKIMYIIQRKELRKLRWHMTSMFHKS